MSKKLDDVCQCELCRMRRTMAFGGAMQTAIDAAVEAEMKKLLEAHGQS